ncbi:conserved hypothetical protein [Sporisorium reilianum SRZ2]|uniref:SET domain-containing protein n=1 Tax=Sporisorium reilianum (strain SRZ2) TaxID=999809 RepID=E6ZNV3_SPORE|nr:conserved hypothetical protein [Sporisorium reilianum SRZ2]
MPKEGLAAQPNGTRQVNALTLQGLSRKHSPVPSTQSALNARACEWWTQHASSQAPKLAVNALETPPDWPKDVVYITHNLVASSVSESVAERYVLAPSSAVACPPGDEVVAGPSSPNNLPRATHNDGRPETLYTTSIQHQVPLVIHRIDKNTPWCPESFHSTSRDLSCHPAAGSFGLFAAEDMAASTFIRPYLGVLHTKADADFYSTYDLSLCHDPRLLSANSAQSDRPGALADGVASLALDADSDDPTALYLDSRFWGNESRFVNDYRGIAAKPNVEFRSFLQGDAGEARFQMGLFATRPIRKGQELLINYGKSFWVHHEQLEQLQGKAQPQAAPPAKQVDAPNAQAKLDPIQAMLQRSRMRVAKTAVARPPHQPQPRS